MPAATVAAITGLCLCSKIAATAIAIRIRQAMNLWPMKLEKKLTISHDGVASHGEVITVPSEGMPVHGVPSEFGKLHVRLTVEMPTRLSEEERRFVGSHFEPAPEKSAPGGGARS